MKAAVAAVQGGSMSERKAAATYCVPRSTLQQCVSGKRDIKPKLGRKPAFQNDDEKKLVDFACNRAQMGVGFGKRQFMKYAADLAKKRQIKFRKGTPSEKWWRLFKKRHQHFVQRKPEGTSTVQHKLMKKDYVMKYFQELKKEISQHGLSPTQIWNTDETGIQLEHHPKKIVARRGSRYLHARTSGSRELITVIAACNASGTSLPPHLIVMGKTRLVLHGFDSEKAPVIFKPYNRDDDSDVLPYPAQVPAKKTSKNTEKQKFFVLTAVEAHAAKLKYRQDKQSKEQEKEQKKRQRELKRQGKETVELIKKSKVNHQASKQQQKAKT